jgi:DNA processing protein
MEKIQTIDINSSQYPKSLKKIIDPPRVLYYRGDLDIKDKPVFAVVGTRRCSNYGRQATMEIVSELSRIGFIIVSGMAHGIDTVAHQTALENNTKTIAVLGTGIDRKSIYPRENIELAEKIIGKGGAVISEFPPGTPGHKSNFPQRNRIISALSLGILVIEAKQRSGALITANYAFQQKKKVFALPGSIYCPNSRGCHYLIKKGAKLAENANDILQGLQLDLTISKKEIISDNKEEKLIIETLYNKKVMSIDEIIEKTELNPAKVNSTLTGLEMKKIIKNLGGNIFTIKH